MRDLHLMSKSLGASLLWTPLLVAALLAARCPEYDGPVLAEDVPLLARPRVVLDERLLRRIEGLSPEESRTSLRFESVVRNVPGRRWQAVLFVPVVRARTNEIELVVQSEPVQLAEGDSTFSETVAIETGELDPGAYVLLPTLVASYREPIESFESAIAIFEADERPAAAFVSAPDEPITILDEGEEAIRSYQKTIASGDPTAVIKGLSALIGHYRIRGQYHLAEEAVAALTERSSGDVEVDELAPIFRFWNVDDRRLAGDPRGAVELLSSLLADAPEDLHFLGEPFRGRALIELARLHVAQEEHAAALDAYGRVLRAFPALHRPTLLMERAFVHLELGNWEEARADYEAVVQAFEDCTIIVEAAASESASAPCPTGQQSAAAERKLAILDSDRKWFRVGPEELVAVFEKAVETRDVAALDAIANPVAVRFVVGGGEWHEARWEGLVRGLLERTLEGSPGLRLRTVQREPTRMTVNLEGVSEELAPGPLRRVSFTLDRTPFGWQWAGVDAVPLMRPVGDDDWDPCPIDIEAGETECPGQGGGTGPGGGGGGPPRPSRYLNVQAPWSPGTHMRAGGLQSDVTLEDIGSLGLAALQELALALPTVTGRCGAGVPGYFYGLGTHTGEDHFAIDYMKGSVLFCIWGACVAPPGAVLAELVEIAADSGDDFGPTTNPAFDKPLLAAHEGLVIDSVFNYPDGDTDSTHANRIDVAVWETAPPPDLGEIVHDIEGMTSLGSILDRSGADFWLKHLHLRKRCRGQCPSRGMWVTAGQEIGRIDDTGKSFTSHLHFVVRRRPATGAGSASNWLSTTQMIDGDLLSGGGSVASDNGKCIKSKNELLEQDLDGDDIFDHLDNCVVVANDDQLDLDRDGIGDVCDPDRDNDGLLDANDPCPDGSQQDDFDSDGTPDACDGDSDGDGVPEASDRCPFFDDTIDFDGDSIPDRCDFDADDDGFSDGRCEDSTFLACGCLKDLFPNNPNRAGDHDADLVDSLTDTCACSDFNPQCEPLLDIPPKGWGGGMHGILGEPLEPGAPGSDPFGPGGGPFGPGGSIP